MRLLEGLGTWTLQARVQDQWQALYLFDLTPQNPSDYEMANCPPAGRNAASWPVLPNCGLCSRSFLESRFPPILDWRTFSIRHWWPWPWRNPEQTIREGG